MKTITTHFWRCNRPNWNFGEALVPLILNHFGYQWTCEVKQGKPVLLMIGSELRNEFIGQFYKRKQEPVVWGFGWSHGNLPTKADVRSVRGPVTAGKLKADLPQGDPGFLVSRAYPRERYPEQGKILYAPHWFNRRCEAWQAGEQFFDVGIKSGGNFACLMNTQFRIDQLCSAEFVMTSSLHVAITCIAYKIPFGLVVRGKEQIDKPEKWRDVFGWLGASHEFVSSESDARGWWEKVGSKIEVPDLQPMIDVFPHEIAE